MCVARLHREASHLAAWPVVALLALALVVVLSLRGALNAWPDDGTLPATFGAAIVDLETTVGDLPPDARIAAGAPARVLLEHARSTRLGLNGLDVPLVEPGTARDLVFAEDAIRTVGEELRAIGERGPAVATATIETLSREALARLRRVDRRLAEHAAQNSETLVRVEDHGDRWLVSRIDRDQFDLVRALGIALLLGGCLAVALRLLGRSGPAPTFQDLVATPPAVVGLAAFGAFVVGSALLVARPAALPQLSTEVVSLPRPGPCSQLQIARDVFWASEALEVRSLTDRARRRVQARARDCLGLESALAAREVTERFLARAGHPAGRDQLALVSGARRPVSLALMPEVEDDVARLQTSVETLLREVESLRTERLARVLPATSSPAMSRILGTGGPEIPMTVAVAGPADGGSLPSPEARPPEPQAGDRQRAEVEVDPQEVEAQAAPPVPATDGPRPFVTTTTVNYRSGPSQNATRLGTLQKGTRVRLVSDDAGWASVRLHDGRSVYVASAFLRAID